jgi:uncharacterized protein (DUF2126 family)
MKETGGSGFRQRFARALQAHDDAMRQRGLGIWLGSEPTFTDRYSLDPHWTRDALGGDKEQRAARLTHALHARVANAFVMRTVGRQYPGEERPRWNIGLYRRRDGDAVWHGPRDPLLCAVVTPPTIGVLETLWRALADELEAAGWAALAVRCDEDDFPLRLVARADGGHAELPAASDPRLARTSIHGKAVPLEGLRDELAAEGSSLALVGWREVWTRDERARCACVELPAFVDSESLWRFLDRLARAAGAAGLDHLVLAGYPPPADSRIAWTTVTPDPAVIEINMAPCPDGTTFLGDMDILYAVAQQCGLSPRRYYFTGQIADSGGGGHVTLGGESADSSPFITSPLLLADVLCYFNRHPALSYYFAVDNAGSSGQSPRTDEGLRDALRELRLALASIARSTNPDAAAVWHTLAPFLTDHTGNTHRAEINAEKLCNPYLPDRGRLGLVEFRTFRMRPDAESATAVAVLLRAVVAMLAETGTAHELSDWGDELHDRFALPFFLRADLREVLDDLDRAGLGLQAPIVDRLVDESLRLVGSVEWAGCRITVKRAVQFWPLVGDVTSQEGGSSRLIDASTLHLEVTVRPVGGAAAALDGWRAVAAGFELPLREARDREGPALVMGLRYRSFQPQVGLHPRLRAQGPIVLGFVRDGRDDALRITLHDWRPGARPYDGVPRDAAEARRRREERFVVETVPAAEPGGRSQAPDGALTPWCLDLRYAAARPPSPER